MERTECLINLSNLLYNYHQILKYTNKKVIGVIKADAYGHGAFEVAQVLEKENISYLAVACLEEAIFLRKKGIKSPILILGHVSAKEIKECHFNNIAFTICSLEWLKELSVTKHTKLHIKIDTGMNRIGLKNIKEIKEAINIINKNHLLELEGIFTHYATADSNDEYYIKQRDQFKKILSEINFPFKYIHTSNSAAINNYKEDFTNAVRPGIILYGISPCNNMNFEIKPVLSLYSKVILIKYLSKGEKVGYGISYAAKKRVRIATVSIGYGDGWLRRNEKQRVAINNKFYNIIGHICMDMMMIQVDEKVKVGDMVELIGENISANEIANNTKTNSYEIITILNKRINRKYINNN